jgi:hypothetical protein
VHKWSLDFRRLDPATKSWITFPSKRVAETDDHILYTMIIPGFSLITVSGAKELQKDNVEISRPVFQPLLTVLEGLVTVTVNVSNNGTDTVEFPTTLWINDSIRDIEVVSVESGDSKLVSFELPLGSGSYDLRIHRFLQSFEILPGPKPEISAPTATPTAIPTPVPPTATPTATPVATATPKPRATVAPTVAPTSTAIPRPTATPTAVAKPTLTPTEPTATPVIIVVTAVPTATTEPTPTPVVPTATAAVPTATSVPTVEPTATPVPIAEPSGGMGGMVIILIVVLIVAVGGIGVAFVLMRKKSS